MPVCVPRSAMSSDPIAPPRAAHRPEAGGAIPPPFGRRPVPIPPGVATGRRRVRPARGLPLRAPRRPACADFLSFNRVKHACRPARRAA
ncbi:hypothetical protein F01_420221 [Burkholderia cenocepacia]|nr:hypothetical protein F01_420221 [Burkholderia cenocepacia]